MERVTGKLQFRQRNDGTELIKNLNWLRRRNELMDKAACMMTAGELDGGEDESDNIVGEVWWEVALQTTTRGVVKNAWMNTNYVEHYLTWQTH